MKVSDYFLLAFFIILLIYVINVPVEKQRFFNSYNVSLFDRVSPPITDNGIEKPLYERAIEFCLKGPSFMFPNVPWLGYIIIFGGLYVIYLKWDIIITKARRKIIYGK